MDNTLPVYTMVYGKRYSVTALVHGAIWTILIPIILASDSYPIVRYFDDSILFVTGVL